MDDVARHLSISKKTLYKCFRDKNHLVHSTIAEHIGEMDRNINAIIASEPNPIIQISKIADFIIAVHKNMNPSILYDLQKYHPESYEEFIRHRDTHTLDSVKGNLQSGIDGGLYRKDMDVDLVARFYTTLVYATLDPVGPMKTEQEFEKMLREVMKYHLLSITTVKGKEILKNINWINDSPTNEKI